MDVTAATGPSGLFSGGQAVTWSSTTNASGLVLTGTAGGQDVMQITFNNTGNTYTVQLLKPLDHPTTGVEDVLTFNVSLSTTGGPLNLQVVVEDDAPTTDTLLQNQVVSGQDANVMIIFDTSFSMGFFPDRITNAKLAAKNLLDTYDASGETRVRLVAFNTSANAVGSEWMSVAEAKAAIEAFNPDGETNYDAALSAAMTAYLDPGRLQGAPNYSYFLTDGQPTWGDGNEQTLTLTPNSASGDRGIQATEETIWKNFLETHDIKSQALAFSESFTTTSAASINPIAYNGVTATDMNGVYVPNPSDLSGVLTGMAQTPMTGTIVGATGVDAVSGQPETVAFGADGGYIRSLDVFGGTFTYDRATDSVSKTGGGVATYTYNASTDELTITDAVAKKTLTVNVSTGAYTFVGPSSTVTVVDVDVLDKDGDAGTVSLTLTVNPDPSTVGIPTLGAVVSEEGFAGGFADSAGVEGDYTNAATATGSSSYVITGITGPAGFTSGGVALSWSTSLSGGFLTMTGTAGADPVMTVRFDNNAGTYTVNLLRGLDHNINVPEEVHMLNFKLTGTQGGTAIQTELNVRVEDDMAGGSLILGTFANDTLAGNSSANLIVGGAGSDFMTGGGGADTFAWFLNEWSVVNVPNDVVADFKLGTYNIGTTGPNAPDRLDLSSLLVGETAGTLANFVNVEVTGGNTVLHISPTGQFTGGIYNSTFAYQHITLSGVIVPGATNTDRLNELLSKGQLVIG